ncbi:hypothetical protein PDENDC454_04264 [Paenibacillus dendritiformis C454]|uniref:DNA-entry nuclease n=1 Tax=Paenibacillus dendritiformis C454 TaxID=1131935 RepID=H3SBG7_9BACL|nr:hypothetical protein [Paenibacillus dendritiformis]EHQ63650.1 hypothetical protein PDENDC454_04264 [Paenibacillus dendritiformis C454]
MEQPIEYDSTGMMKYHPDYHPKRGEAYTDEELCYLAKFYKFDGKESISLALDRPGSSVQKRYIQLAKSGLLEHYRKLDFYI